MFSNTFKISRWKVALATVAFSALLVVPAGAATDDLTASVDAGTVTLSLVEKTAFTAVNYSNNNNQTTDAVVTVGIDDSRGTDDGWSVSLDSTAFQNTGQTASIAANNLNVASQANLAENSGNGATSEVTLEASATDLSTAKQVAYAATGGGTGDFTWDSTLQLTVPAGTPVDSYTGTITVTQGAAPVA